MEETTPNYHPTTLPQNRSASLSRFMIHYTSNKYKMEEEGEEIIRVLTVRGK